VSEEISMLVPTSEHFSTLQYLQFGFEVGHTYLDNNSIITIIVEMLVKVYP